MSNTQTCIIINYFQGIYQLTAGDRGIIMSIDTVWGDVGVEGALQNHQVLTGGAVHIIQSDGGKVGPKTALKRQRFLMLTFM